MSTNKCPLCGRKLIDGFSIDDHHLIPRSVKKNDDTITLHKICHQKLHATFSEKELGLVYDSVESLLGHEEIQKFVKWVRKKHPEYYDSSRDTKKRNKKRKKR